MISAFGVSGRGSGISQSSSGKPFDCALSAPIDVSKERPLKFTRFGVSDPRRVEIVDCEAAAGPCPAKGLSR
jgi:hypothetical protein